MEIRPGYKHTELGVIPKEWRIATLGSVSESSSGATPPRAFADRYYRKGHIPWVKTLDLNNGRISCTEELVTQAALNESSLKCYNGGTVLVAMYGGFNQIGRTGLLCMSATVNQALTAVRPDTSQLRPEYLLHVLNFRVDYWQSVASSSRKDPNITSREIRGFPLALPELIEQDGIAEALSDADAFIESLEQLIAKKRQIKQGAMQELLTGKKRLPGFSGNWDVKLMSEIADVKTGPFGSSLHERDYVQDGTPIITVEHLGEFGVIHNNLPRVSNLDRQRLCAYSLEMNDIVFSRVGSIDRNALIRPHEAGWLFSGRLLRVRFNKKYAIAPFMSYQFHSTPFKQRVRDVAVGQTMPCLNTKILNGINVEMPSLAEQTSIAAILSDMDTEIVALETKLAKSRQLKQGMMQELLTGRIRLV